MKNCRYCRLMIPKNASICPHCGKKQGIRSVVKISAVLLIFLIGFGIMAAVTGGPVSKDDSSIHTGDNQPHPFMSFGDTYATQAAIVVCFDVIAMERLSTSDELASLTKRFIEEGRCMLIREGTKVFLVRRDVSSVDPRIIKIGLAGGSGGQTYTWEFRSSFAYDLR